MEYTDYRNALRRRDILRDTACGIRIMARSPLLSRDANAEPVDCNPLTAKAGHFPARAKNVIFLFMEGGPSQLDLFDPKPDLAKLDGAPLPESMQRGFALRVHQANRKGLGEPAVRFVIMAPRECRSRTGFPILHRARTICAWCGRYTATSSTIIPGNFFYTAAVHCVGRPSMGSWLLYGLGSESQDFPGFVVLSSGRGSSSSSGLFSNGFLPSVYQGVPFSSTGDPIPYLSNPQGIAREDQRARIDLIRTLNDFRRQESGDEEIASRIASYELAFRMQTAAPELLDFATESQSTLDAYGINKEPTSAFAHNCLMARRLVERGVRFVLVSHASWDDHASLESGHKKNCEMTDKPSAALIRDLKQRGMLKDTIVVWGGEFGRTPLSQTTAPGHEDQTGRDHHPDAFTMLLAGGGIKPGLTIGKTDDLGMKVVEDKVHIHDLHATILHCLGLNHLKLTYRHQGRDFRLTDVAGEVAQKMLS